jgi:hypothetical protein
MAKAKLAQETAMVMMTGLLRLGCRLGSCGVKALSLAVSVPAFVLGFALGLDIGDVGELVWRWQRKGVQICSVALRGQSRIY